MRELQQSIAASLRPEDFGYEDSEDDEEQEDTFEEAARKTEKKTKKSNNNLITDDTIELKKDIKALSKKEQMEVLMRLVPDNLSLFEHCSSLKFPFADGSLLWSLTVMLQNWQD